MILGFTGSRATPTDRQLAWLWRQFDYVDEFHHGCCVGADEAADRAARDNGVDRIIGHPPVNETYMMARDPMDYWLPARPYHARNRDVVRASDRMIALPDGPPRPRSGTWYTIDYAIRCGKRVTICYPDGTVEEV